MAERAETSILLSSLYATLENPESWAKFLQQAAAAFRSRGAQILHQDMLDFRLCFTEVHGYDWSQETYAAYAELIRRVAEKIENADASAKRWALSSATPRIRNSRTARSS